MTDPAAPPERRWSAVGLAIAVFFVSVNLRPAVASVGPVLNDIRDSLHLSTLSLAVLTSLPVVAFGALAPLGPWLSRKLGLARAIGCFTGAVLLGLVIRVGPDAATLFSGTLVVAAAIAALNVLLPALIKRDFPGHTGVMMGVYTLAVTGSAAMGAGLTVPLAHAAGGGWRTGLGVWAVLAAAAVVLWLPQLRFGDTARVAPLALRALLRDRVAWWVTLYFGLQSLSFYAVLTWLPTLYEDHGVSAGHAGALMSVSAAVQAPVALAVPAIAVRVRSQIPLILASAILTAAGFGALLAFPMAAPYLWVAILGLGQGAVFPQALTLVILRTRTAEVTQQLSSMAQGVGYLIAAAGPLLAGSLHALTGRWTLSLVVLTALLLPQVIAGAAASKPRFAGD